MEGCEGLVEDKEDWWSGQNLNHKLDSLCLCTLGPGENWRIEVLCLIGGIHSTN